MKKAWIIILILSIVTLGGCRSSKSSTDSGSDYNSKPSLEKRFTVLTEQYNDWADVNMSMKFSLLAPQKITVSGKAYMTRNKSINISLRFLGMEVVAMHITNDSIFATDKMHKYYLAESLSQITKGYGITINDIQDLLLGQAFLIKKGTMQPSMKKQVHLVDINDEYWAIEPKTAINNYSYAFAANLTPRLTALAINKQSTTIIDCEYSNHTSSPAGTVAQLLNLTINTDKQPLQASINWDTTGAKWNNGTERNWKKPNGYTRISFSQLIKTFVQQ